MMDDPGRDYGTDAAKLLAHPDLLQQARERRLAPLCVQVAPTEACDSRCPFCNTAGRPEAAYLPLGAYDRLLRDFRALGARALILTGGGNPLVYRDRAGGAGADALFRVAAAWGYRVGLITNSLSLAAVPAACHDAVAWVRVSLAKLEEGATAGDYDLAGFPEDRVGFSLVLHEGLSGLIPVEARKVLDRFPKARFLRLLPDAGLPRARQERAARLRTLPLRLVEDAAPPGPPLYAKGAVGAPYAGACLSGLYRPFVAAPPDGRGEYQVYACCWHWKHAGGPGPYDRDFALCGVSEVREAWPRLWRRWQTVGYPYEVRGNGGTGWERTCAGFCGAAEQNRLLADLASPPADAEFA